MDQHLGLASREDFWRLQNEIKNMYATQAEHADRISRLEQHQDGEPRVKPTWGTQSPYSGIFSNTPNQEPGYNPAAEAFKNFDQGQATNMMSSIHLETEEEPRRGASRANSVRFDETALQGAFGHGAKASSDFLPTRSGSAFGAHPLTERSSSHKSDGRQSSAGHSIHSNRANSFGLDSRPLSATVAPFVPQGPPPGLFILGPVPSIIRCWLNTQYTNDSLLYAVVCTASYKSTVSRMLVSDLGHDDRIRSTRDGQKTVKLPVYLPEATMQKTSSRSNSPAHQLPTLTVEFSIEDWSSQPNGLQIYIGCDVLRSRSGDIHFSLDRLTILDDDRNKLSVPLVRPENAQLYQDLQTVCSKGLKQSAEASTRDQSVEGSATGAKSAPESEDLKPEILSEVVEESKVKPVATPTASSPSVIGDGRKFSERPTAQTSQEPRSKPETDDSESLQNGSTPDDGLRRSGSNVWGSWRRENGSVNRSEEPSNSVSASGYQRVGGRGRGMKVLKPARLTTSRSSSIQQATSTTEGFGRAASPEKNENQRRAASGENRSTLSSSSSSKPRSSNPIGGASAFGWLNSGAGKSTTNAGD